jgi:hypothetical protein
MESWKSRDGGALVWMIQSDKAGVGQTVPKTVSEKRESVQNGVEGSVHHLNPNANCSLGQPIKLGTMVGGMSSLSPTSTRSHLGYIKR